MRDLEKTELAFVYGAGCSPCPPKGHKKHKGSKSKGSKSKGSRSKGSRSKGGGSKGAY